MIGIINTTLKELRMLQEFIAEQTFQIFPFPINHNRH